MWLSPLVFQPIKFHLQKAQLHIPENMCMKFEVILSNNKGDMDATKLKSMKRNYPIISLAILANQIFPPKGTTTHHREYVYEVWAHSLQQ